MIPAPLGDMDFGQSRLVWASRLICGGHYVKWPARLFYVVRLGPHGHFVRLLGHFRYEASAAGE